MLMPDQDCLQFCAIGQSTVNPRCIPLHSGKLMRRRGALWSWIEPLSVVIGPTCLGRFWQHFVFGWLDQELGRWRRARHWKRLRLAECRSSWRRRLGLSKLDRAHAKSAPTFSSGHWRYRLRNHRSRKLYSSMSMRSRRLSRRPLVDTALFLKLRCHQRCVTSSQSNCFAHTWPQSYYYDSK